MTRTRRRFVAFTILSAMFATGYWWMTTAAATPEQLTHGKMLFEHQWTVGDKLAGEGDGLGPVFNADSCVACHFQGGVGGGGPNQNNVLAFQVIPMRGRRNVASGVVHSMAVLDELLESELQVSTLFPMLTNRPSVRYTNECGTYTYQPPDFDPVHFDTINTPALFGAGLIDKINFASVQIHGVKRSLGAISACLDGDMSQMLAGRLKGRFGWKGQFNSLEGFVAAACAMEVGLSNPLKPQPIPGAQKPDEKAKWDMDRKQLRDLVAFVASLPAPKQVLPEDAKERQLVLHGETVFSRIGCADCHTPNLGGINGLYSDLRLYDITQKIDTYGMVEDSEFTLPVSHPTFEEWKTPPLWGVADSAPYFHDGGSPTLEDAIDRHGSSAANSQKQFTLAGAPDRRALLAFLKSLRAPAMP